MTTIPRTSLLIGATALWLIAAHAAASQFYRATDLIDPNLEWIGGLSYDGSTVVGQNFIQPHLLDPEHGHVAFRWSRDSGQVDLLGKPTIEAILGDFNDVNAAPHVPAWYSRGDAVSDDGSVILAGGTVMFDDSDVHLKPFPAWVDRQFRWTQEDGFLDLGMPPGQNVTRSSRPWASSLMSADGSVITGMSQLVKLTPETLTFGREHTFRWTVEDGMQELSLPDGASDMVPNAISADGSVVVGETYDANATTWVAGRRAFRWTTGDTAVEPFLDQPSGNSDVSSDGSVVVGYKFEVDANGDRDFDSYRAYRWTQQGGIQELGTLPAKGGTLATHISRDGSIVLGYSRWQDPVSGNFEREPFIWDAVGGMRSLQDELATEFGLADQLQGWTFTDTNTFKLSANNQVLAGKGLDPMGEESWWIAYLDRPLVGDVLFGDVNRDGVVNGLDVDPFVDVLVSGTDDNATRVLADMTGDGVVNGLDVEPFVAAVVSGGTQQAPEPSTLLLVLVALGIAGGWRKWAA